MAVTLAPEFIVTVQLAPDVLAQPDQLVKVEFELGTAVSVVEAPHVPDVIPETLPEPVPAVLTVTAHWSRVKVAVTLVPEFTVTVQTAPEMLVQPDQLVKVEFELGTAVSVVEVPHGTDVVPVTVPDPVPAVLTVAVQFFFAKVASTFLAAPIVTVQVTVVAVEQSVAVVPVPPLPPVTVQLLSL